MRSFGGGSQAAWPQIARERLGSFGGGSRPAWPQIARERRPEWPQIARERLTSRCSPPPSSSAAAPLSHTLLPRRQGRALAPTRPSLLARRRGAAGGGMAGAPAHSLGSPPVGGAPSAASFARASPPENLVRVATTRKPLGPVARSRRRSLAKEFNAAAGQKQPSCGRWRLVQRQGEGVGGGRTPPRVVCCILPPVGPALQRQQAAVGTGFKRRAAAKGWLHASNTGSHRHRRQEARRPARGICVLGGERGGRWGASGSRARLAGRNRRWKEWVVQPFAAAEWGGLPAFCHRPPLCRLPQRRAAAKLVLPPPLPGGCKRLPPPDPNFRRADPCFRVLAARIRVSPKWIDSESVSHGTKLAYSLNSTFYPFSEARGGGGASVALASFPRPCPPHWQLQTPSPSVANGYLHTKTPNLNHTNRPLNPRPETLPTP